MATANLQIVITALDKASGTLNKVGSNLAKTGDKMGAVGKKMTMGLTLPIIGIGVAATKMGLDFGKGIEYANTMLKLSGEELDKFKSGVLDLSDKYGKSADDIARAAYSVSSVLHTTGEETITILDAISAGAKAGKITTEEAGNAVIRMMSIYDIEAKDTMKLVDTLSATVKAGNANWQDMAQILPNVAGLAKPLGISLEEVAAAFAATSAKAGSSAEAGTALRGVFTGLMKPSEEMKKAMKEMGYENSQAALKAIGLKGVLTELGKEYGGNAEAIGELFPNIRGITGAVALFANEGEDLAEAMSMVEDSTGETQKQIEAGRGSAENFADSMNKLKNAGIRLFTTIEPYLSRFMEFLSGLADKFGKLSPEVKKFIVISAGIVAAAGPLLIVGSALIKTIGLIGLALKGLKIAIALFSAHPIILAIMAVIAVGILLWKNWDKVKKVLRTIWEAISKTAKAIFGGIIDFLKIWGEAVRVVFTAIGNFLKGVLIVWKEILRPIWQPIIEASARLINFLANWFSLVSSFIYQGWTAVSNTLKAVWNTIYNAFVSFMNPLKSAWGKAWDWIVNKIKWVLTQIRNIASKIRNVISPVINLIQSVIEKVSGLGRKVGEGISGIGSGISNVIGKITGIGAGTETFTGFQHGGIARSPMLAKVAETEPEAIIPLSKLGMIGGIINIYVQGGNYLDREAGEKFAEELGKTLRRQLRYQMGY